MNRSADGPRPQHAATKGRVERSTALADLRAADAERPRPGSWEGNSRRIVAHPSDRSGYPPLQPVPRLDLHLAVELVRRVVEPRAAMTAHAGLGVTGVELLETCLDTVRREQAVPRAVDDQQWRRHRQRRHVGIIEVLIKPRNNLGEANRVADLF